MVVGIIMLRGPPACEVMVSAVIERRRGEWVVRGGRTRGATKQMAVVATGVATDFMSAAQACKNNPDPLPSKVLRQRVADPESVLVDAR